MKRLRLIYSLVVVFLMAVFGVSLIAVNANTLSSAPADAKVSTVYGSSTSTYGSFYADTVREYNDFGFGVYEENLWGYSASSFSGYDVDGLTGITGTKYAGTYYSQNVNTIVVTPSANVIVTPWANVNNSKWTLTTVKNNIADFQAKNPGYTVVCAINGNSFDINGTGNLQYQPSGPHVAFGDVYRSASGYGREWGFTNDGTSTSVITTMHSSYSVGGFVIDILDASGSSVGTFPIAGVNAPAADNASSVWYGSYDSAHTYNTITMNGSGSVFVVGTNAANTVLENGGTDFYGKGAISSTVNKSLEEHEFAVETNNADLKKALSIGKTIRVQRTITGDFANCDYIMGTFHRLYENSTYVANQGLDDSRAPRTFLGYRADGTIVLSCVDGRQGGTTVDSSKGWVGMYGMDGAEEAAVLKYYGCTDGMNLDGGGSSTVVVKDDSVAGGYRVTNYPSDGNERRDGNCILIAVKQPELTIDLSGTTQTSAHLSITVNDANGLDLTNMYLKLSGSDDLLKLDDKKSIDITGLKSNTTYAFTLYYGSESDPTEILKSESFKTLMIKPLYRGIAISDSGDDYLFAFSADDPEKTISSVAVYFSASKYFFMTADTFKIAKSSVTQDELAAMYVKISYQLASYEEVASISTVADSSTAFKRMIGKGDVIPAAILG